MKNITKNFVEIDFVDMESKSSVKVPKWFNWKVTKKTYEEAVTDMKNNPLINAVRIVKKTFHPDTFEITSEVLCEKTKMAIYDLDKKEYVYTYTGD